MKLDLKYPLVFVLGAVVCYGYFFLSTNLAVAKIQGQVETFGRFCPVQLEQSGIVSKEKK